MKAYIKIGIKIVFLCVFCFLLQGTLSAQVFPASATVRILPPYNTFIRELSQAGNERLQVILLQKDLSTPSYQVRLKFKVFLDGGLLFETKPSYIAPVITIEGGIPTLLSGGDLSSYFDAQNLNFAGMSQQTYLSAGNVPEGVYQFCATVYDAFIPTKVLSNAACQSFFMVRSEPPLLNMPACGTAVLPNTLLTFRWNNVSSAGSWEYKLELFEIRNADGNPNNAVASSNPVFTTTTRLTNYAYTPADPPLLANMRYAWRVVATDLNGINQVRNNGNSLVCDFTNEPQTTSGAPITAIAVPLGIQAEAKSPTAGRVFWTPFVATATIPITDKPDSYHVEYKKVGASGNASFEWFKISTSINDYVVVTDLEPSTQYQARMQAKKGTFFSDYSSIVTFTTPAPEVIVCGTKPASLLGSQVPYVGAMSGDKITIDGFELVLDSLAEGEGGYYGGDGLMSVEFLGGKQFEVYFEGLFINELKEGGEGKVWFKMRETAKWIDDMTPPVSEQPISFMDFDEDIYTFENPVTGILVSPTGIITLQTANGTLQTDSTQFPPHPRTKPILINTQNGNQFIVHPDGTVTALGQAGFIPQKMTSEEKLDKIRKGLYLEALKDYKTQIETYYTTNNIAIPSRGPRNHNKNIIVDLPECIGTEANEIKGNFLAIKDNVTKKELRDNSLKRILGTSKKITLDFIAQKALDSLSKTPNPSQKTYMDLLSNMNKENEKKAICGEWSQFKANEKIKVNIFTSKMGRGDAIVFTDSQMEEIKQKTQNIFDMNNLPLEVVYNKSLNNIDIYAMITTIGNDRKNIYACLEISYNKDDYGGGETEDLSNLPLPKTDIIIPTRSNIFLSTTRLQEKTFVTAFLTAHEVWHACLMRVYWYSTDSMMKAKLFKHQFQAQHHDDEPNLNMDKIVLEGYKDFMPVRLSGGVTGMGQIGDYVPVNSESLLRPHFEKKTMTILPHQKKLFMEYYNLTKNK